MSDLQNEQKAPETPEAPKSRNVYAEVDALSARLDLVEKKLAVHGIIREE